MPLHAAPFKKCELVLVGASEFCTLWLGPDPPRQVTVEAASRLQRFALHPNPPHSTTPKSLCIDLTQTDNRVELHGVAPNVLIARKGNLSLHCQGIPSRLEVEDLDLELGDLTGALTLDSLYVVGHFSYTGRNPP